MRRVQLLAAPISVLLMVILSASMSAAGVTQTVGGPGQCGGPAGPPCPTNPSGTLIQIAKTASPTSLPAGGGPVTYTYTVTNGGSVPLTGVTVTDNACAPVTFVGGDTNANGALDVTETWTFTCTATLTVTTTNTATAKGFDTSGNGTAATATATVTVGCSPLTGANCTPPPTCPPGTVPCPTPTPTPTPTPPPCDPATNPNCPPPPTGTLCVIKFNDLNGNGFKAATEPVLGGAIFTISPVVPPASQVTPAASGQVCWTVPAGSYTITESGPLTTGTWVPTTPVGSPSLSQTVAVAAGTSVTIMMGDHRFLIDHFECYTVSPTGLPGPFIGLALRDQFASRTAAAIKRIDLCNPAQKTLQGVTVKVTNPQAHLFCYLPAVKQPIPQPTQPTVMVANQFGNDVLRVVAPTALCLPTSKSLTQDFLPIPTTLGHYLCYSVVDLTRRNYQPVALLDQFGRRTVEVIKPVALCNPVQKTYQGKTSRILNPTDHLVCYTIVGAGLQPVPVRIRNQFEAVPLRVLKPYQLCVPSLKRVLKVPLPPPTTP